MPLEIIIKKFNPYDFLYHPFGKLILCREEDNRYVLNMYTEPELDPTKTHHSIAEKHRIQAYLVLGGAELSFDKNLEEKYILSLFGFSTIFDGIPANVASLLQQTLTEYMNNLDYVNIERSYQERVSQLSVQYKWNDTSRKIEKERKRILSEHSLAVERTKNVYDRKISSRWRRVAAWLKGVSINKYIGEFTPPQQPELPEQPQRPGFVFSPTYKITRDNIIIKPHSINEPISDYIIAQWDEFLSHYN